MNVSLTPELESLVNRKVQSGLYNSASEVVREGLRLLEEQDRLKDFRREDLLKEVMKGIEDIREGRFASIESDQDLRDLAHEIKQRGRKRLKKKKDK